MEIDAIKEVQNKLNSNPKLSAIIGTIDQEYKSSNIMMYHSFNGVEIETYVGFKENAIGNSKDIQLNYPYIADLRDIKSFMMYPINFNLTLDNKHYIIHHKSLRKRSTSACGGYRANTNLEKIYLKELISNEIKSKGEKLASSSIDIIVHMMIADKMRGV